MNVPNILTSFRIFLVPVFVVTFYLSYNWRFFLMAGIFTVAALTDWLDGYLARKLQQSSSFGKFLDPVADKLLVTVALVLLSESYVSPLVSIPALTIVGREVVMSALREWMARIGKEDELVVSTLGKTKTLLQMIAIIALLAVDPRVNKIGCFLSYFGLVLLHISSALAVLSLFLYFRRAWKYL